MITTTLNPADDQDRLLRRTEAAKYVTATYGFPCSPKTLAKIACTSSEGPPFRKVGRIPLYPVSNLDAWAQSKIGPLVRSTSEVQNVAQTKTAANAESDLGYQDADLDRETAQ
jgi:hypothetical protein